MSSSSTNTSTPNLLIAGAPKCGTTSLANYLSDHPHVFFSMIKEPFYWASDMPKLRSVKQLETTQQYEQLFSDAGPESIVIAEGSTLYLYSDCAIADSLAYNPDMKYIVMLRRPVDVAHAYHMQNCFVEAETEPDFESAWRMQEERLSDSSTIAPRCRSAKLLQYSKVAALGTQLERAMAIVPSQQLHVILFDDFVSDTQSTYESVLDFLELAPDHRTEFAKVNSAMKSNSVLVTRMMRSGIIRSLSLAVRRRLSGRAYHLARAAKHRLMFRRAKRESLSPEFRQELVAHFEPEVQKLEQLLDRDLSHWNA